MWQPIESQRTQLWASRFGKAELLMDALGTCHFQTKESASDRATLLKCAEQVGLDADALNLFLDSDELYDEVWHSYGHTIRGMDIHSIPVFVFSLASIGGPFRDNNGETFIHNGSGSPEDFVRVFETAYESSKR